MQKTKFAIDFLTDKAFEGYTRGENWNGFACPYFTFDQAQQLVEAWKETGSASSYDSGKDEFNFQINDGEKDSFGAIKFDGTKLYPIGNGCWIWSDLGRENYLS